MNIRIGAMLGDDCPELRRHYSGYLSHADAIQIVERCNDAPEDLKCDIFEAAFDNRWRCRDISHTQDVLGCERKAALMSMTLKTKADSIR